MFAIVYITYSLNKKHKSLQLVVRLTLFTVFSTKTMGPIVVVFSKALVVVRGLFTLCLEYASNAMLSLVHNTCSPSVKLKHILVKDANFEF